MATGDETGAIMDALENRYFGKYRGKVESAVDPLRKGRLSVTVPAILGQTTVWAMPCVPFAGDQVGFYSLPEAGAGRQRRAQLPGVPAAAGGQVATADAVPGVRFWRTSAISIRIDDMQGEILIEDSAGSSIRIGPGEIKLTSPTITQSAQGATTKLTPASFDVNNGAFTVV